VSAPERPSDAPHDDELLDGDLDHDLPPGAGLVSEIPASLDGERVDRVVALLTALPRAAVTRLIDDAGVVLDGEAVHSRHRRVATGEQLEITLPDVVAPPELLPGGGPEVVFSVVYEDAAIIIVDKPAGLVVHPGAGHREDTLAAGLVTRFPDLVAAARDGAGEPLRPGIVHRLDKDTSGLLVVARTPEAYRSLVAQLAERSMGRTYRAIALGTLANDEGTIDAPIGRSERDPTRMVVSVRGREARTHYRVLERFETPVPATLLEITLETGRTHQIRVHLSAIGHPILGDARYGGAQRQVGVPRPFLHAEALRLIHPVSGAATQWFSLLPADLSEVLGRFA
jgi:23S rRNA pseudouridine1911/1915/1917 synthase